MKKILPLVFIALLTASAIHKNDSFREFPVNSINPNYKHSDPKKVGDRMPFHRGQEVYTIPIYKQNIETKERKEIGIIYGVNRDANSNAEYEYFYRFCDNYKKGGIPYAVLDIPNEILYIDSSRNNKINTIVEWISTLEKRLFPMIPIKCK